MVCFSLSEHNIIINPIKGDKNKQAINDKTNPMFRLEPMHANTTESIIQDTKIMILVLLVYKYI